MSPRLSALLIFFAFIFPVGRAPGNLPIFAAQQTQSETEARALYQRFYDNFNKDAAAQRIAYEAAKEYLQKYAGNSSEVREYLRKWVGKYEQVARALQTGPAAQEQNNQQEISKPNPTRLPVQNQSQTVSFKFKREPLLGMALPGEPPQLYTPMMTGAGMPDPDKQGQWLGAGPLTPGFRADWNGVELTIGADMEEWVITYVATSDPAFRTSEGLSIGDTAARVLAISKGTVTKENDYVFYVKLPSGWNAQFGQADYDAQGKLIPNKRGELRPETKVARFYKKAPARSTVKETITGTVVAESASTGVRGNTASHRFVVRTKKQAGQGAADEFIIVRNVYSQKRDQSRAVGQYGGTPIIVGPHLTREEIQLKQPLELSLFRDESCDATLESISYGYVGTIAKDGRQGTERMPDLNYIFEEDIKRLPKNVKLRCYVLRANEYRILQK
jgi:hypothetical protein